MKRKTNLDAWLGVRLAGAPPDEFVIAARRVHWDKVTLPKYRLRDKFVKWIAERIIFLIMRDEEFRRRLCLSLLPEMRRANEWADKPASLPPMPKK